MWSSKLLQDQADYKTQPNIFFSQFDTGNKGAIFTFPSCRSNLFWNFSLRFAFYILFPWRQYSFNPPRLTASHSAGLILNLTIINEFELGVWCSHKMGSGSRNSPLMYSKQVKLTVKICWGHTWVSYKHWYIKIIEILLRNSRTISPLASSGVYYHWKRLC